MVLCVKHDNFVLQETMRLEEKQEKLQQQVQKLREEREHLLDILKIHSQVCPKMARLTS
jgi:hypothetical protein